MKPKTEKQLLEAQLLRKGTLVEVVHGVFNERTAQDKQWGGKEKDDKNTREDWIEYIRDKVDKAELDNRDRNLHQYRHRLLQIAALAVAAAQSFDRTIKPEDFPPTH